MRVVVALPADEVLALGDLFATNFLRGLLQNLVDFPFGDVVSNDRLWGSRLLASRELGLVRPLSKLQETHGEDGVLFVEGRR